MSHYPVMLPEVLTALSPKDGEVYVDGTFGAGCGVLGLGDVFCGRLGRGQLGRVGGGSGW